MERIIAFGTFDIFHPGHRSFLEQAKKLGDYLLVVVARDENTFKAKGRLPQSKEARRSSLVRKAKIANKVILGSKKRNYFRTLRTYRIDTIALGYDQKPPVTQLKKELRRHRLGQVAVVRLKPYNSGKYKTSKLLKLNRTQL